MSDRPLQVGDVVVVVKSIRGFEGSEGTVMEIRDPERAVVDPQKNIFVLLNGKHSGTASGCYRYDPAHLRLKKPPADPKSDFLPADDDFTRDLLKQLGRVTA